MVDDVREHEDRQGDKLGGTDFSCLLLMQLLPCLCGNAPVWCLAIISSKGEIVWSTDEELDAIIRQLGICLIVLFLCTVLNSDDPKHVHVTFVSSGASSKNEAWPSIGFCIWRRGQARARNLSGCSLKS